MEKITIQTLSKVLDSLTPEEIQYRPSSGPDGERLAWDNPDGTCYFDILRRGTLIRFSFAADDEGNSLLDMNDFNRDFDTPKSFMAPGDIPSMEMYLSLEGGVAASKVGQFAIDCHDSFYLWIDTLEPTGRDGF
jgi:hypothetical protein